MADDPLEGFRDKRAGKEDTEALEALLYARDSLGLSDDIMKMYTLGVEVRARLKTDKVLMWLVEDATNRIMDYFHIWLHADATEEELVEIRRKALAYKLMVDGLGTLKLGAMNIEKQLENE